MSWASRYISELQQGRRVTFRPRGHSMVPLIKSGEEVTVKPINGRVLKKGDIVLCQVKGKQFLHKIVSVVKAGEIYLIGNNRGRINGRTPITQIYGVKES